MPFICLKTRVEDKVREGVANDYLKQNTIERLICNRRSKTFFLVFNGFERQRKRTRGRGLIYCFTLKYPQQPKVRKSTTANASSLELNIDLTGR